MLFQQKKFQMSCGFQKLRVEWNLKMNCSSLEIWRDSNTFIVKRGYNGHKSTKAIKQTVMFE